MAVLSTSGSARLQWRDAGCRVAAALGWLLFAAGWLVAKTLRTAATAVGAVLYVIGWVASAAAWPGLCWCGRAVLLGWRDGMKPIGGRRGPA